MSTVPPYQGPTEPLRPVDPPVAPVVAAVDPVFIRLERALASLRTGLIIAGVVAVAALAVAVYAAVTADDNANANGSHNGYATNARVDRLSSDVKSLRAGAGGGSAGLTALAARVAALESASKAPAPTRSGGDAAALAARVTALESTVKTLASRPASPDATSAIQQLSARVDTLSAQVAQLKQSSTSTP